MAIDKHPFIKASMFALCVNIVIFLLILAISISFDIATMIYNENSHIEFRCIRFLNLVNTDKEFRITMFFVMFLYPISTLLLPFREAYMYFWEKEYGFEYEFERFIKKWKQETNYLDINTEIIDDAYYRILVKKDFWITGQLLSALRDYPIGCSMILSKITGYNPIKDADSTNIDMIIEGWQEWNNWHPYVEKI